MHTCHARRCWHAVPCATSNERYWEFAEVVRRMTCNCASVMAFTGVQLHTLSTEFGELVSDGLSACRRPTLRRPDDPSAYETKTRRFKS